MLTLLILSSFACLPAMMMTVYGAENARRSTGSHNYYHYNNDRDVDEALTEREKALVTFYAFISVCGMVEGVVAVAAIVLCSRAYCCRKTEQTNMVVYSGGQQQQPMANQAMSMTPSPVPTVTGDASSEVPAKDGVTTTEVPLNDEADGPNILMDGNYQRFP